MGWVPSVWCGESFVTRGRSDIEDAPIVAYIQAYAAYFRPSLGELLGLVSEIQKVPCESQSAHPLALRV